MGVPGPTARRRLSVTEPFQQWTFENAVPAAHNEWAKVEVDLDLSRAVNLVATVSADLPISDSRRTVSGGDGEQTFDRVAVEWQIQDSLCGNYWNTAGSATARADWPLSTIRISSALGRLVRIRWRTYIDEAKYYASGGLERIDYCRGHCGVDHDTLRPQQVRFDIGIRNI